MAGTCSCIWLTRNLMHPQLRLFYFAAGRRIKIEVHTALKSISWVENFLLLSHLQFQIVHHLLLLSYGQRSNSYVWKWDWCKRKEVSLLLSPILILKRNGMCLWAWFFVIVPFVIARNKSQFNLKTLVCVSLGFSHGILYSVGPSV